MRNLRRVISSVFMLGFGLFLTTSCKNNDLKPNNDAINLALADSRFTVFRTLLIDNGLAGIFNANEPYTVFAPTNEAFSKIDINKFTKADLIRLLNTHIVTKRRLLTAEITSGTVQSPNVEIYLSKNQSGIFINGISRVVSPDILVSNGVIHVIDNVLLPPTKTASEILRGNPNFSEFASLFSEAGGNLQDRLIYPSVFGFTILAPTNAAFEELYKTIPKATLLENKKLLNEILLFHLIFRRIFSTDFPNVNQPISTSLAPVNITVLPLVGAGSGPATDITITDPNPFLGQYQVVFDTTNGFKVRGVRSGVAHITNLNLLAKNCVIHTIDKVLLP